VEPFNEDKANDILVIHHKKLAEWYTKNWKGHEKHLEKYTTRGKPIKAFFLLSTKGEFGKVCSISHGNGDYAFITIYRKRKWHIGQLAYPFHSVKLDNLQSGFGFFSLSIA
jgi:hypothetical protein